MEQLRAVYQQLKNLVIKPKNLEVQEISIEFSDFFMSEKIYNFIGFSFFSEVPRTNRAKVIFGLSIVNLTLFTILDAFSFIYGLINDSSFAGLVENLATILMEGLVTFKMLTTANWYKTNISNIITKLRRQYPNNYQQQQVYRLTEFRQSLKIIQRLIMIINLSVVIEFIAIPPILKLYGWIMEEEEQLELILLFNLPFDVHEPIIYTVLYISTAWAFLFGVSVFIMTDLLFAELLTLLCMEFRILGETLSEIAPFDDQDEAMKKVINIMSLHLELIEVSEQLEVIFSPLLFVNCFTTILVMCLSAVLTLAKVSMFFLCKYFLVLCLTTWNGFNYCYNGDRLNNASLSIAKGAYNSNWYNGNVKFQKIIQVVMIRSQRTQNLTALKFFDVSLETFHWMCSTAYSYYSLLAASLK